MKNKLFNIGLQFFAEQSVKTAGVKGQEAAAPATDDISSKERNAFLTDADIESDDTIADTDGDESDDSDVNSSGEFDTGDDSDNDTVLPVKGQKAKTEQDAVYADIRRKAESEARIKATQEAQRIAAAEVDKAFADMGLRDPYTNKAITTKKEYDAYKARHQTETISNELGKAGISREAIDAMIDSHPAVIKAKEAAEGFESAKRQSQDTAAKVHLDSQIGEIMKFDPDIKGIEDIMALPNYEDLKGYVRKGLTLVEAYKLTNMEKLTNKTAKAAAQSAYNKSASKEHLTSSASRGQGENPVPKGVMDMYKKITKLSDKEIREHYSKHNKKR